MSDKMNDGDRVRVHYTGRLASGNVFDSSNGGDPLEFMLGVGQVIKGFDEGVRGMKVGEKKVVDIPAEEAYGPRREQLVGQIPRNPEDTDEPQVGMSIILRTTDGREIPGIITAITETEIAFDANHPLAGERLIFDLELVEHHPRETK
jgi:peptidylprolyl isomerase